MIRIVQGDRHPVHGNDFERLTLKLKVEIAIRGSIHKTPKLALTGSDFNLRPHPSVQREDLFWRLWLRSANIRTEFNAMLQIGRHRDRKSTRLNSSHGYISYAVFCLKKKQ